MNFPSLLGVATLLLFLFPLEGKLPDIQPKDVTKISNEMFSAHASFKEVTPVLAKRILTNYLEELDPSKTYFLQSDIQQWIDPSDAVTAQVIKDFKTSHFDVFEDIYNVLIKAIKRRAQLEKKIHLESLPQGVKVDEFKDMKWAKSEQELLTRLERIKALQIETASKLNDEMKVRSLQRIEKRQAKYEDEILTTNLEEKQKRILTFILKATASALDAHSNYFTPDEANQFMIHVQQRLFGIGVLLRDDINGFTVSKIVEGGPASLSKQLKLKDRIVAVNGEPVVGMDITDAVDLIRGDKNTTVTLTVIRQVPQENGEKKEEKLDISLKRDEVVLKESRFKTSYEPYGNGVIGYIRLYTFYQDQDHSSASDIQKEIERLKKEHHLIGLILDLRYNLGGLLTQAVDVTGLFITKGIVVSIKDENGKIQHLRDIDGTMAWDGPLVVLINRASASASEIVAQTLQDYGRAIIVGDDHSYGKGSYQTFTLNTVNDKGVVNPQGEFKVTRGRYYTVSGKTPQLTGVQSDIVVPGPLSEIETGEAQGKFPLENDHIKSNFDDDLSDVPFLQREKLKRLYRFSLQEKLDTYKKYMERLKQDSKQRIESNMNYQNFLKEIKKKDESEDQTEIFGSNDLQLTEAVAILKDLILMMHEHGMTLPSLQTASTSGGNEKK